SCAVEEKTAADQDVMTRAQPVTGPLSSVRGMRAYYTLPTLLQLLSLTGVYACLRGPRPTACGRDGIDQPARMSRARCCDRGRPPRAHGMPLFTRPGREGGWLPRAPPATTS